MYAITEIVTPTRRHVVATFPTFAAAVAHAKATFPIVVFEIDTDHAEAADFFTSHGSVYAIQAA